MSLHVHSVTFDASDPARLATFWGTVFGVDADTPSPFVAFVRPDGSPPMMFIRVDEPKTAKNRCHLDIHADSEADVEAEVTRLVDAGASIVTTYREYGVYWTTLHDPEGNELCIGTPTDTAPSGSDL